MMPVPIASGSETGSTAENLQPILAEMSDVLILGRCRGNADRDQSNQHGQSTATRTRRTVAVNSCSLAQPPSQFAGLAQWSTISDCPQSEHRGRRSLERVVAAGASGHRLSDTSWGLGTSPGEPKVD